MSSPATPPLVQQQGRTASSSSSSSGVCARVKMYSGRPYSRMEMGSILAAKSAPAVQIQPLWMNFSLNETGVSPLEKLCSGESQHNDMDVDPTTSLVNEADREEGLLDSTKKPEHRAGQKAGVKGQASREACMVNSPERSEVTEDMLHVYSASSRRRKGGVYKGVQGSTGSDLVVDIEASKLQEHVQAVPAEGTWETCTNLLLRLRNHKLGACLSPAKALQLQQGSVEYTSAAGDSPLDLVQKRLTCGSYAHPVQFADDVRAVFKAVLASSSASTTNDLQGQALTLWRLFEEDVALHGVATPELVSGRSKASLQNILQQHQQGQPETPPVVQHECLHLETVGQARTAALPPCTAPVEAKAPAAEAGEKGRYGSSSPGGSPRVSSSGCGGDVSRSAWSTEVSGVTSWSPVWGGEREEEEEHQVGEQGTIEGILQVKGTEGGALASLKDVREDNVLCTDVYSEGPVKRPRSKGKSQKKRSFGGASKGGEAEDADDGTGSETEEASVPLSSLLVHHMHPGPEAKAVGAPGAVKAEPGLESRKKPRKHHGQANPSPRALVANLPGATAAADASTGAVVLEGSPQELAALEVLSGLLPIVCTSDNYEAPDEESAHRGARGAAMNASLASAAAASGLKPCSTPVLADPWGAPAANFGEGAAASVLASMASLSREGSLTHESAESELEIMDKKPPVHSLSGQASRVHKVLRRQCRALPGLLLVSESGVAGHGPSSTRSTSSSGSARGKGPAGKRGRGGGFMPPSCLGLPPCGCSQAGMEGLCSTPPARTPSVVTSGWVAAAGPPRRARSTTPGDLPTPDGHRAKGPHSPGLRSARTHLSAENVSTSRRSMPAIPGCNAPVPRPMGSLYSPVHDHGLCAREVSPDLGSGDPGVARLGLESGLASSAPSGDEWGLMTLETQAELPALLARGLDRRQEGVHMPVSGEELSGASGGPLGGSAGSLSLEAWQSQSVDPLRSGLIPQPSAGAQGVSGQQLGTGGESHDGEWAARTRGYRWDRATRPRRAASVASEVALAAAAAAGSHFQNFPNAALCSKQKGFVSSPGLARMASGPHLPSAGILPGALSEAAASPVAGLWSPPPFQLPGVSTQKDAASASVPKACSEEAPGGGVCARTNNPFCWAAHVMKNKKRMAAAGPFPGFYGPSASPVDCEAAAAAAAVLGFRGGSAEGSQGSMGAPAGTTGAAHAHPSRAPPLATPFSHSVPPSFPLSYSHSLPHSQPWVLAPQRSSAGSADIPGTPLLAGGAPAGARVPLDSLRLGGRHQAAGAAHPWATLGEGAPTKVVGSRKPPISTCGAGHPGGAQASNAYGTPAAPCNSLANISTAML